jgi:hypothetical protein
MLQDWPGNFKHKRSTLSRNLYYVTHEISLLETLFLLVWIYVMFIKASERNVSPHLPTVKGNYVWHFKDN